MAFTPETGAGVVGANAYVTEAYVVGYAADRGLTFAGTQIPHEQAIVKTTDYLDRFPFVGSKKTTAQGLQWPRSGASDSRSGLDILDTIVPEDLKRVTAELAIKVSNGTVILQDLDRGGLIKSASAGPVSVTYMDGAPAEISYGIVQLLEGILIPGDRVFGLTPQMTGNASDRQFWQDQFSYPQSDAPASG